MGHRAHTNTTVEGAMFLKKNDGGHRQAAGPQRFFPYLESSLDSIESIRWICTCFQHLSTGHLRTCYAGERIRVARGGLLSLRR